MPKPYTVTAGNRGASASEKVSQEVLFSTFSEVKEAFANGKAPEPWESLQEFYLDAFAHKVVKIQGELRTKDENSKPKGRTNRFLD